MERAAALCILMTLALLGPAQAAARLKMDDKASVWPRAGAGEKFDFTNRVGKSMSTRAPDGYGCGGRGGRAAVRPEHRECRPGLRIRDGTWDARSASSV